MSTSTLHGEEGQSAPGDYTVQLRVLGEPVKGKVVLEAQARQPFRELLPRIAAQVGVAALWEHYQLHPAVLVDSRSRKVRPRTHVVQPDDTVAGLRLGQSSEPHLFMLRYKDALEAVDKAALSAQQPSASPATLQDAAHGPAAVVAGNDEPPVDEPADSVAGGSSSNVLHAAAAARSYRERMVAMYNKYDKAQLYKVDLALRRYKGYEEDVIAQLVRHYGPEPPATEGEAAGATVAAEVQATRSHDSVGNDESRSESSGTSSPRQVVVDEAPATSLHSVQKPSEAPLAQTSGGKASAAHRALTDSASRYADNEGSGAEHTQRQPQGGSGDRWNRYSRTRCSVVVRHGAERLAAHSTHLLLRVYWQRWLRYRDVRYARRLLAQGTLWRRANDQAGDGGDMSATLADEVYPALSVPDLAAHLRVQREARQAGAWVISDEGQCALRGLVAQLKRVAMQSSLLGHVSNGSGSSGNDDDEPSRNGQASEGGARSTSEAHTCTDETDRAFVHSLRRATRILVRHGDVVEQLQRLRAERDAWQGRLNKLHDKLQASEHAAGMGVALRAQLDEALRANAALRSEVVSATRVAAGADGEEVHALSTTPPAPRTTPPPQPTPNSDAREEQDAAPELPRRQALLTRLHQELAAARTLVHQGKQRERALRQQLDASAIDMQRLRTMLMAKHDGAFARTPRGHVFASDEKNNSDEAAAAATVTPRRGMFSEPHCSRLGVGTPRRTDGALPTRLATTRTPRGGQHVPPNDQPSLAAAATLTAAMMSSDGSAVDELPADACREPLPMSTDVDRGACPLCRAKLTSCSPEVAGPAAEAAAFCFRCRRAFSFAELAARDRILSLIP